MNFTFNSEICPAVLYSPLPRSPHLNALCFKTDWRLQISVDGTCTDTENLENPILLENNSHTMPQSIRKFDDVFISGHSVT